MNKMSALVLGGIVVTSVALVFKKSKETQEECQKAEIMLQRLIEEIDFS